MTHPLSYLNNYRVILGSSSPRRKELLATIWSNFEVRSINADESFPLCLKAHEIPEYLAEVKAKKTLDSLKGNEILVTADTIVWSNGQALNKPENREDAFGMLRQLSGAEHQVYTGVHIIYEKSKSISLVVETRVCFKPLSEAEIDWYIEHYKPFDKAGGYGIQEWIGFIGISQIHGDYYNVMGLPVSQLYDKLKWLENELNPEITV